MTILLTGASGQIGQELLALQPRFPDLQFIALNRSQLDVSNLNALQQYLKTTRFDACINSAAYTAVDKAEQDKELAFIINAQAPGILAEHCCAKGVPLIHYSSDYVYHNQVNRPLLETDPTTPKGIYAQSKLEGDFRVLKAHPGAVVFRTSWVYSSFGHNFVKTMLRLGAERSLLRVVQDQIGSPTYARDIALMTLQVLQQGLHPGVFNYSNEGVCSWYDFAQAIFELSGVPCQVEAIPSSAYPTPASRPSYSVLDKSKFKSSFGLDIPYWRTSLQACLGLLGY